MHTSVRSGALLALFGFIAAVAVGRACASEPSDAPSAKFDIDGDPLPPGAVARLGTLRFRYESTHKGMAFRPNTHELVVADGGGLTMLDAENGKRTREMFPSDRPIRAFALSPDGTTVATLAAEYIPERQGFDVQLGLWDVEARRQHDSMSWFDPGGESSECVAFADSPNIVVTSGNGGKLRFWDFTARSELLSYAIIEDKAEAVAVSPDGQWVAAAGPRGVARWRWLAGAEPETLLKGQPRARAVTFSPDGKWLATGSSERRGIRVWDMATQQLAWRIDESGSSYYPDGLSFTPDSQMLAVPCFQGGERVELREAATGKLDRSFDSELVPMREVAISSDGQLIAGRGGTLRVWRLATGEALHRRFIGHDESPYRLEFTSDGTKVVSGGLEGAVHVWDATSGRQLHHGSHDRGRAIVGLATSGNGKWAASTGFDYALRIWDLESGEQRWRLHGHAELGAFRPNVVGFTPDNRRLLSFGNDLFLRTWDLCTGKAVEEFEIRPSTLKYERLVDGSIKIAADSSLRDDEALGFMADHARLTRDCQRLMLHMAGALCTFDTASGNEIGVFKPEDALVDYDISPDGALFATVETLLRAADADAGGQDRPGRHTFVRLRDLETKKVLHEMALEANYGHEIAFSPDGRRLAASVQDLESRRDNREWISVWDTATGKDYARIGGFTSATHKLAFSPNADRIAASHADTTILIWDVDQFRLEE